MSNDKMNTMNTTARRLGVIAAAAALTMLAACNKAEDKTVGQKIDQGIATTEQKADQAAAEAKAAADAAAQKTKEAAADAGQKIDQAAADAKAAAERAGDKVESAAKTAGDKVETAAKNAGEKIEQGAEKAADAAGNATLTASVKTALLAAPDLKSLGINVDSNNGVVTLKGEVKTAKEKEQAERVSAGVNGVRSVVNELKVAG